MKAAALRDAARFLVYTSGAVAMVTLFAVVPLMLVFGLIFQRTSTELLAALGTLALVEIPVVTILAKTCSSRETARSERRKAVRVPVGFGVEISSVSLTGEPSRFSLTGWAVNASRGGLAVLVGQEWRMPQPGYVSVRTELPGSPAAEAKAQVVSFEEAHEDERVAYLLRLNLVVMDHEHQHRYIQHLNELGGSNPAA